MDAMLMTWRFIFCERKIKVRMDNRFPVDNVSMREKRRAYIIAYKKCKQKISRHFSKPLSHCRCKYTL
jgi:hypothetical protein